MMWDVEYVLTHAEATVKELARLQALDQTKELAWLRTELSRTLNENVRLLDMLEAEVRATEEHRWWHHLTRGYGG